MVKSLSKSFEIFFGKRISPKSANFGLILGQICSLLKVLKNKVEKLHISWTLNRNVGTFYTLEKPEKSSKPDKEKPGPPEARYIKARARPKPEKSRPGTSLIIVVESYIASLVFNVLHAICVDG